MSAVLIREKSVRELVREMIKSQSMVGIISQVLLERHPEIGREKLEKIYKLNRGATEILAAIGELDWQKKE
jgi:hypothetical protein